MIEKRALPVNEIIEKLDSLLSKNDYEAARGHLLFWKAEAEAAGDRRALLLLCNELMGLTRKLGERDNAVFFAKSAIEQIEKMGIEKNVGAATTYLNCATVYKAFGEAEKAMPLFERAKFIYEKSLLKNDERLAGLYNNMALALVDLKDFSAADEFYKKAIAVLENNEGKEPEQAITYLNMASAAEAQHGLEKAEGIIAEHIEKAMQLLDSAKNQNDGNYAFVCEKCATVFGYYGYFAYENELTKRYRRIYEGA